MQRSLTKGPITGSILLFALPLMLGNLLQQMYNIADTWVVGRFLGADALAAVGSSYTLMTFLTSILLGLCMGSGAAISMQYGSGEQDRMRQSVFLSFTLIAGISLVLNVLVYLGLDGILWVLRVPEELRPLMKEYLLIIFLGITATFLYNYFANLLRAIGNSVVPLLFLAVSGCFGGAERRSGSYVRAGAELGSEGRGGRNSVLAVRVRHWHRVVHSQKIPAVVPQKGRLPLG